MPTWTGIQTPAESDSTYSPDPTTTSQDNNQQVDWLANFLLKHLSIGQYVSHIYIRLSVIDQRLWVMSLTEPFFRNYKSIQALLRVSIHGLYLQQFLSNVVSSFSNFNMKINQVFKTITVILFPYKYLQRALRTA